MIFEVSRLIGLPVVDRLGNRYADVDFFVFDGKHRSLAGAQLTAGSVVKKFYGLNFNDVTAVSLTNLEIKDSRVLETNLKSLDEMYQTTGKVIGCKAVTEDGHRIGTVTDLLIDGDGGNIIRMVVRSLLHERIIPVEFVTSITPKQVVFKKVVNEPTFNKLATAPKEA